MLNIGLSKKSRRTYGFDEVSLVPGRKIVDHDDVDTTLKICGFELKIPFLASAMDGVVSPKTAVLMGKLGAAGVLNLQGIQTRYDNPDKILKKITSVSRDKYIALMQEVYREPIKDSLVIKRIKEIKSQKVPTIVSSTPQGAQHLGELATRAGADAFLIQSTVVSTEFLSKRSKVLNLKSFCKNLNIPVMIGNCVTYEVALDLMEAGAKAVFVGIGPGAACTSRGVLGIGVPMATTISDVTSARDYFYKKKKRYIPVIADGGMTSSGDICKAIALGADAIMVGSPFARAKEAPGRGYHWGMAAPNATLPRGTRLKVGTIGTLKEIVVGPAKYDDGSENLWGALKLSMSTLGARNLKEMQQVEVIVAPSILTEGKVYQKAQQLGMHCK